MFIVLVWDDDYIAQFSKPSPAEAISKARELLSDGRRNVLIRDNDRNEYRPELFEALQKAPVRQARIRLSPA